MGINKTKTKINSTYIQLKQKVKCHKDNLCRQRKRLRKFESRSITWLEFRCQGELAFKKEKK